MSAHSSPSSSSPPAAQKKHSYAPERDESKALKKGLRSLLHSSWTSCLSNFHHGTEETAAKRRATHATRVTGTARRPRQH